MNTAYKKTNAARRLDDLAISYELRGFEADEKDLSAERAAVALGLPEPMVYKTLVARGDRTGVLEACLPAGRELDPKSLAVVSGNKSVALVAVKDLPGLTGYLRGGCSPLGGKKEYPVFIHEEILKLSQVIINAGARGLMFLMKPEDLIRAAKARTAWLVRK